MVLADGPGRWSWPMVLADGPGRWSRPMVLAAHLRLAAPLAADTGTRITIGSATLAMRWPDSERQSGRLFASSPLPAGRRRRYLFLFARRRNPRQQGMPRILPSIATHGFGIGMTEPLPPDAQSHQHGACSRFALARGRTPGPPAASPRTSDRARDAVDVRQEAASARAERAMVAARRERT
jgi:hypothetical protein